MRIGIIGSGNMAEALGRQRARAGHRLLVGGRNPHRSAALAGALDAEAGSPAEAARFGETALLAVPHHAVPATLRAADPPPGLVLIDCTNPIDPAADFRLVTAGGPALAERIAALAPGVQVAKAFNLGSAELWRMTPPATEGRPLLVPYAAATTRAGTVTAGLITDLGCAPLALGGLDRAGQLEAVAALGIRLLVMGTGLGAVMPSAQPGPPPGAPQPAPVPGQLGADQR